jgi:hypothetical protein
LELQKREQKAWAEFQNLKKEQKEKERLDRERLKTKASDDNKGKSDTKWNIFNRCKSLSPL